MEIVDKSILNSLFGRILGSLGVFFFALSFSQNADCSSFFPQPFPKTVQDAPVILKGKIGSHYADWGKGDNAKKIYTYYEFQNEEILKGTIPSSSPLMIREMGGEKDGIGLHIEGAAYFETGESVVVLLKEANSEGTLDIHGMMLGKLNLEIASNGDEVLKGPALWGARTSVNDLQNPTRWTLADLRRLIREQSPNTGMVDGSNPSTSKVSPHPSHLAPAPSDSIGKSLSNQNLSESSLMPALPLVLMILSAIGVLFLLWKFLS